MWELGCKEGGGVTQRMQLIALPSLWGDRGGCVHVEAGRGGASGERWARVGGGRGRRYDGRRENHIGGVGGGLAAAFCRSSSVNVDMSICTPTPNLLEFCIHGPER
jgi:hypothetical protein